MGMSGSKKRRGRTEKKFFGRLYKLVKGGYESESKMKKKKNMAQKNKNKEKDMYEVRGKTFVL